MLANVGLKIAGFDMTSEEGVAGRWRQMQERQEPGVRRFKKGVIRLFRAQETDVLIELDKLGEKPFERSLSEWQTGTRVFHKRQAENQIIAEIFRPEDWWDEFRAQWKDDGSPEIFRAIESLKDDLDLPVGFNVSDPRIGSIIATQSFRYGQVVNETTQGALREALRDTFAAGGGSKMMSEKIRGMFKGMRSERAEMIARTEMAAASEIGTHMGMLEAKRHVPKLRKMWLATRDKRTREAHGSADQQVQEVETPFIVGGYQMMYPLDTGMGAPLSQIVRCRCTSSPVMDENVKTTNIQAPISQVQAKNEVAGELNQAGISNGAPRIDQNDPDLEFVVDTTTLRMFIWQKLKMTDLDTIVIGDMVKAAEESWITNTTPTLWVRRYGAVSRVNFLLDEKFAKAVPIPKPVIRGSVIPKQGTSRMQWDGPRTNKAVIAYMTERHPEIKWVLGQGMHVDDAIDIAEEMDDLLTDFPWAKRYLKVVDWGKWKGKGALERTNWYAYASSGEKTIRFNDYFIGRKDDSYALAFARQMKADAGEVAWTVRGTQTLKGTAAHEFGHIMDYAMRFGVSPNAPFRDMIREWVEEFGPGMADISQYSTTNKWEMVAEAMSAWRNGDDEARSHPSVKAFAEMMHEVTLLFAEGNWK